MKPPSIKQIVHKALPPREQNTHKGTYGHVVCIAGSTGMTGAAYLTAQAALRSGAGLVTLAIPASLNTIMEIKLTEVMTIPVPDRGKGFLARTAGKYLAAATTKATAVALGPGLATHDETKEVVRKFYREHDKPLVVDADGLNAFAGRPKDLANNRTAPVIITPHPGEFDRLFGTAVAKNILQRKEEAVAAAKKYNVYVVLKGHWTVVAAPDGAVYVNETGNPGMASGGTGDVLTGIIAAFLGFGMHPFDAACCGVYMHGCAGDAARDAFGEYSMTASDVINTLPVVMKSIIK